MGRTETIENQPNARSALRLEALLPDPIQERKMRQKAQKEAKKVMNRHDQFHGEVISFFAKYLWYFSE